MPDTTEFLGASRPSLEKHMRGGLPQTATAVNIIPRGGQVGSAPLSFGQQQLWFLAQLKPDIPVYNECVAIHLPGPLDIAALEQSFNEIIRRHEVWRTSFPTVDGRPIQMIHPALTLTLPVVDLRYLPEAQRETEILRLATENARIPFDPARGPLVRAKLMQFDDTHYRLFLTLHHIIFDGFSLNQVFLPELYALYEAFSAGQNSPLPTLSIQYADYAQWQRETQVFIDQLAYWKQQLAVAPAALELPTDRPRPPILSHRGSIQPFALSKHLTERLKALSRQEGVSLFTTLVAAFQTLLHRYTGQDDILIGTSTAGRQHAELQQLLGYFLNTLVLRTNLSGNPPFRKLLRRVHEVSTSAYANKDVPFEYVVRELQPNRTLGQNPLFQVMLTLEPLSPPMPLGWSLTRMDVETNTAKLDLSLALTDRPEGLIGCFEYSTDLFDKSTIVRMVGHWQSLLESIAENPEQYLAELPLLIVSELQQLLVEWNTTQTVYPRDLCIHQLFEAQVERTPDDVAVIYEDTQLTYRELNSKANQLAHYLRQLGVGSEVLVGLCMERSLEMIVGLLGILKAGGSYVPLDPTFPAERIAFMLEDAQVPVLVTQQHLITQLPNHGAKVVCLATPETLLAQQSETNLLPVSTSANLAYVIYTSGSTGRPKGVQILHRAVVNFLMSMRKQPGLTADDTLLAITTLSFDIAGLELFLPLIVGARLIIASRDVVTSGRALAETLSRSRTTVMQATPATWRMLLAAGWQGDQRLKILCGGEALPLELAQQLLPKAAALWNLYGPTETTIWSTVCKIEPEDTLVTIGRPIANTQVYILDAQLHPVSIGVPGELYIGGDGLARGYLNRPALTAERFIPHPCSNEPGARLYKTGDLARYRPDGTIEHLGRLDFQVKIRGFRIELGEIESVLAQHPAVRQAVVVAREDTPGDKRLVAYVVPHNEQTTTIAELQSHVKKHVPSYMLPSAFMLIDALPLTPNGKVDRRALPAPRLDKSTTEATFEAPKHLVHYQLVQIWEELLNVRPIGVRDNFFDLGGHSLLATLMVDRIEQVFGKKIPLSTLFAGPTIEHLSNVLLGEEDASSRAPVVAVQAGGSKRSFFYLHGDWESGAFYCFSLARDLGSDQPFYVLEPYRFDDLRVPPTFEAMAAAHIKSLRTIQPEGPYLLGGWCNAGLVAYEMARQLRVEGQTIDLLMLMDPAFVPMYRRLIHGFMRRIGSLLRLSEDKQLDLFLRLRHIYNYLRFSHYRKSKGLSLIPTAEALRQHDWISIFDWVASEYVRRPYAGKITFLWCSEEPFRYRVAWRKVVKKAKEVEEYVIPGTHITSRTGHLDVLSEHLSRCLSEVQASK